MAVRHAEVHNPKDILYGRLPRFRLNNRGREQSEMTARFLEGRPLSAIYSSPLLRARQTAEIIASHHPRLRVRLTRTLLEVKTSYEGHPNSILKKGFSFYEPKRDPGDESMEDVWGRLELFLQLVLKRHPGETIGFVSHGDPIAILRLGLLSEALTVNNLHNTAYPQRASVNQVVLNPSEAPQITYFNVAGSSQ